VTPSNVFSHERATSIGPARWGVYIDDLSAFQHFMKTDNTKLRRTNTSVKAKETLEGVKSTLRKALIESEVFLAGDIMENVNPDALALVLGDRGSLDYTQVATSIVQTKEIIPLTVKAIPFFHPHSKVSALPAPTGVLSELWDSGSSIAADEYWIWVTAHYNEDDDIHHSSPAASTPTSVTVTGAAENIIVQWTAPTSGNPHHYCIWVSITSNIAAATKWGESTGLNIILTDDVPGTAYSTTDTNVTVVKDYAEAVTYVANDDYIIDDDHGTIRRVDGGDIDEHESVVITYHYREADNVTMNLGAGNQNPVYAYIRIHQLSDDSDGTNVIETGLVIDLWRVDLASDSVEWPTTEDEFFTGVSVEFVCTKSPVYGTIGKLAAFSPDMDNRELLAVLNT